MSRRVRSALIIVACAVLLCACGKKQIDIAEKSTGSQSAAVTTVSNAETVTAAQESRSEENVPEQSSAEVTKTEANEPEESSTEVTKTEENVPDGNDPTQTADPTSDTASDPTSDTASGSTAAADTSAPTAFDFTICFAGDINLAEDMDITAHLDSKENGIHGCISEYLLEEMNAADIMCINNEFTYSRRGKPIDKSWNFRADPERVEVLKEMGADVAVVANNHVYDFGKEGFEDTLQTLTDAGIPYFGAGMNREEAMRPAIMELQGKKIAFVAASRAEKYIATPEATENSPGVLRCYDPELFIQAIAVAKEQADIVIAVVHWGTEYSTVLEEDQLVTGPMYLDAGADIVIGAHSHCLQGMEFYDGKPIIYSLGNYWFNGRTLDTMLLRVHFFGDAEQTNMQVEIIPAIQSGYETTYVADFDGQRRIFDYLESISINAGITDAGILYER